MPDNASTRAADYAVTHGFKILRVAAGMRVKAFGLLQELEKELVSIVEAAGEKPTLNSAKYKAMLVDAQVTIADTYKLINKNHGASLSELAGIEWNASNAMINRAVGVDIVSSKIPPKILEAVVQAPVVLGHSSKDWWNGQSADLRSKFQQEMAKGTLLGETTPELIKRLRGAGVFETPVPGSPQGIMKKAKRDAEALVLSSSATIANHARLESFKAKSDLIKGIQWVSTLDSRTTPICMALDGKQWRLPDLEPVGHDKAFPGPTAHWRCRSTQISVLRSWQELSGKKLPTLDDETIQERVDKILEAQGMPEEKRNAARARARASMDGQVASNHTYETWAKGKGSKFIEEVIGPGRAALYNAGQMTFSDLTDQQNRPITLKQLEASVATGINPPETLGAEFLPLKTALAKYTDPELEAKKAEKEKAKAEAEKLAAIEKAANLAAMKTVFVDGEGTFTDAQLAMWKRLPQEEKDVYLADWNEQKAAKKAAAKAAVEAKLAAEKAAQEAEIAKKAAEEAAKQAAAKAKAEALAAKKKAEEEAKAKALAEAKAKAEAEAKAKAEALLEEKFFEFAETQKNNGGAFLYAQKAALTKKGSGPTAVLEAYNKALDASVYDHLSAFELGLSPLDPNAKPSPLIKKAFTLAKKANPANPLEHYQKTESNIAALTLEAANKKIEASIVKKSVAWEKYFNEGGKGKKPADFTADETAYSDALPPDQKKALNDAVAAKVAADAAKKIAAKTAASTVPPAGSAAVVPPSVTKPDLDAKNQDLYFPDPAGLTVIKSLPGSTAPKLVRDPATGKEWVLKQGGGGGEHLQAEATADKLYRTLGASVPGSHYGTSNGSPYKIAEYIEGVQTLSSWKQTATKAEIDALHAELKKHFVTDALLANWDVAGLSNDNILVKNGKPIRIDNGGSLMFRAQGSRKSAGDWGAEVKDLKSLRDAKKNPNTAEIFKGIKQSDIDEQIVAIVAKKDELVKIVADAHGDVEAKILADRIDYLEKQLPASKKVAPKGDTTIGDLVVPPKFEEHVRTRFGTTIFAGGGELEDQQLTVWRERDTAKNDLIKAQGVLTLSASRDFVSKLDGLGLNTKTVAVSNPYAAPVNSKAHPEDSFWPAIQSAIKTVNTHAADGKYNSTTIFAFNEAKKKILAMAGTSLDADKKAMITEYSNLITKIDEAIAKKTTVTPPPGGGLYKQFEVQPKAAPKAPAAPTDQVTVNGVTITRTTTNRITYTTKQVVNGVLEDTGNTNRDVQTPAAYKLQRGNVEVTVVPYDVSPGSQRSYQGVVRVNVKGTDPTTAIPEALAVLKDAGVVADVQPTLAQKELVYLQKGFYLRDDHTKPEYIKILSSSVPDEQKVKEIKALANTLYGVKLPDSPSGFHRYYNPEGELPKNTAGARFWRRWDEPEAVLKKAEKDSAFYHNGRIATAVKAWLLDGGHTTSTIQRLRTGVPLSSGGASSDSDLSQGGGNFFYTNYVKASSANRMKQSGIYFSGDSVTRLDLASHTGDSYGAWEYQQGSRRRRKIEDIQSASGIGICINTGLHKNGISMENVNRVVLDTAGEVKSLISELQAAGITTWPDGRKLEEVIITK